MPPTSGVVAPVPLTPSSSLASHLRDLYQMQATPMHPGFGGGLPTSANHLSALSAISLQHRQLLELHQRYVTASRLAAAAASAGNNGVGNGLGLQSGGVGAPPPPLSSISSHNHAGPPSIIPPSRIQSSTTSGKFILLKSIFEAQSSKLGILFYRNKPDP